MRKYVSLVLTLVFLVLWFVAKKYEPEIGYSFGVAASVSTQAQTPAAVPVWVNGELVLPAGEKYMSMQDGDDSSVSVLRTRAGDKIRTYYQHGRSARGPWKFGFTIKETPVIGDPRR